MITTPRSDCPYPKPQTDKPSTLLVFDTRGELPCTFPFLHIAVRVQCGAARVLCKGTRSYDALRDTQWVTSYVTCDHELVCTCLRILLITCVSSLCLQRGVRLECVVVPWPCRARGARPA